ncbi:MAG: hypothetical protein BWY82_02742 [Verrucomicrobia bacterium ADurb.Bin474]|nr:MAG: hypothetical protein BWY82_02742 [Verrucomicrobia bacterium ADurb.Bin474]
MVINHIQNDSQPLLMASIHHIPELSNPGGMGGISRISTRKTEIVHRHVAPVVFLRIPIFKLLNRLKLNRVHPKGSQVVSLLPDPAGKPGETTSLQRVQIKICLSNRITDMDLRNHQIMPTGRLPILWSSLFPGHDNPWTRWTDHRTGIRIHYWEYHVEESRCIGIMSIHMIHIVGASPIPCHLT